MIIAFDVDDTLIIPAEVAGTKYDQPNYAMIDLYLMFQKQGHRMIVWSYGGKDWAEEWNERLGLNADECRFKDQDTLTAENSDVDLAFDDCNISVAKLMVKVPRYKNQVNRAEFHKRKHTHNKFGGMIDCKGCHPDEKWDGD